MRVAHLITGLSVGGAETMLWKLLRASRGEQDAHVISLTEDGPVGERIRALGIGTTALGLRRGTLPPAILSRCATALRRFRPEVLQTWMYHSDLVGGIAARWAGHVPVIWGIRNSTLDPVTARRSTIWVRWTCARLSRLLPRAIVSCSRAAAEHHAELGYDRARMRVIPNGFDLAQFAPDPDAPGRLRSELGLPADALVVGMAARFDPQKDHRTFLRAAARVRAARRDAYFLLCGDGVTQENRQLAGWVTELGLNDAVRLLGRRNDLDRLTPAWDVAALSSSSGEAFPNTLGEAMSCGVPCVTTDVGDSRYIVGDTGRVVAAGDAEALAAETLRLLEDRAGRRELGRRARERVEAEFSMPAVARRYLELYGEVLARGRP